MDESGRSGLESDPRPFAACLPLSLSCQSSLYLSNKARKRPNKKDVKMPLNSKFRGRFKKTVLTSMDSFHLSNKMVVFFFITHHS